MFADALSKYFNTTYFTSNFEHNTKSYIYKNSRTITINSNLKIIFTKAIRYKNNLSVIRLISHLISAYKIYKEMSKCKKPDLIICAYPIPELAIATILYSKVNDVKFIIDLRDLWPETNFSALSLEKKLFLFPIFLIYKVLSIYIFKSTEYLISLTNEFESYAKNLKGRSFTGSEVIPLLYKKNEISKTELNFTKSKILKKYSLKQTDWIVIFVGSVNDYFEFDPVVNAAKKVYNKKKNIKFVIIGDGNKLRKLKKRISEENIHNIIFTGWLDKSELTTFLSIAKVGLAPYRQLIGFENNITNKIFEYIAHGLPILTSSSGKMKKFINANKIGFYYSNDNFIRLASKILMLSENIKEYKILSKTSLSLYEKKYQFSIGENRLLKFTKKILI